MLHLRYFTHREDYNFRIYKYSYTRVCYLLKLYTMVHNIDVV